jgi:hypothetical protein
MMVMNDGRAFILFNIIDREPALVLIGSCTRQAMSDESCGIAKTGYTR